MLDFVLGIYLAGLLARGWLRGLVREALDLVGLVAGLFLAFRLGGPLGGFLTDRFGVSPEVAVIGAGVFLFVLLGVATTVAAHYLTRVMTLPGLNLINRLGGAVLATAWGIALALVAIGLARVLPVPETWEAELDRSRMVELIAGPEAIPQRIFDRLSSGVLGSVALLQDLFGVNRAVPEGFEVLSIPAAGADEVRQARDQTVEIFDLVNRHRTGEGLRALDRSRALDQVAESRAQAMYTSGRISREAPPGGSVSNDLAAAGIRLAFAGENLALAGTARAGFEGMLQSPSALAQLALPNYDRLGIAVAEGPSGHLLVIVFGG